jgi:hypothetical protein
MSKEILCKKCAKHGGKCTEKCLPKGWDATPEGVYTASSYQFELNEAQTRKLKAWERAKPKKYLGPIGGHTEIRFQITSIGYFVSAHSWDGTEIDLTEYDKL